MAEARARVWEEEKKDTNDEIYVINADGTEQINLTNNPADDCNPAWSPDGSKIAFVSDRNGTSGIYVMNANGGESTKLTASPRYVNWPMWSQIGDRIAFHGGEEASDEDIYLMNADGTGQTNLTNSSELNPSAAWWPDGHKIVFTSKPPGGHRQLYVMDADGSRVTLLPHGRADAWPWQPTCSPDNRWIACSCGHWSWEWSDIYVIRADGTQLSKLTRALGYNHSPTWSPKEKRH